MPLEDFFTLTEMKDGLATLARVEELVGVMKEKENIIKNAGDAARQWSTVASILAATEKKECLNYFIQLDGLLFLDQWIQEAQKCCSDTSDSFSEESINALLGVLEKLPIDNEWSTASGIGLTVKNLLGHKNCKVQERARALFGSWNQVGEKNTICQDVEGAGPCLNDEPKSSPDVKITAEDGCPKSPVLNVSPSKESAEEGSCVGEIAGSELQHSKSKKSLVASQVEIIDDVKVPTFDQNMPLNQADANGFPGDAKSSGSSRLSNTYGEILPLPKDSIPFLGDVDGKSSDISELKDTTRSVKEMEINMNVNDGSLSNVSEKETCDISQSSKLKELGSLPASPSNNQKFVMEDSVSCNNDAKEGDSSLGGVDCGMPTFSHEEDHEPVGKDGECHAEALQDPSNNGCTSRTIYSPENSLQGKEAFKTVDDVKELVSESNSDASEGEDCVIASDVLKLAMDTEDLNEMDERNSDMELEYGEDDALEVARRVAKEVEREVVDYRGPFCSSSPVKNLEGEIMRSDSSGSIEIKQDESLMEKLNEIKVEPPTEQDLQNDDFSPKVKRLKFSGNADTESEDRGDKLESPASTAGAQELVGDVEKSRCDFDLNDDVYTQEIECPVVPITSLSFTLSAPIAVFAASKGTPGLPSTPLHFQGELGWRGSASTSAFRPPSPRRTQDGGEKISLVDASSNGSKQRRSFLKFDLNVASDENDAAADLASAKHVHMSSGLPSRESSIEVSSRRAERLNLDLNRLGDSDDTCPFPSTDWSVDGRLRHQNGHHSQSPASSSSSRQPPMRDFDLNDNPLFADTRGSHDHWQNYSKSSLQEVKKYGSYGLDDPVMSIMGSRVDVDRKEPFNRAHSFLTNGHGVEAAFGVNLARLGGGSGAQPSSAYVPLPSPAFGYHDLTVGPTMSFPLQMYGPTSSVPYMVDSRGATVIPQILGSAATISAPSFSRQPFLMGLPGAPTGSTGVGVAPTRLDLNSGMITMDGERKEMGSLRQFFGHGHGGSSVEEQMRSALHPAGTGMPLKRKEPERGRELNMVGYK